MFGGFGILIAMGNICWPVLVIVFCVVSCGTGLCPFGNCSSEQVDPCVALRAGGTDGVGENEHRIFLTSTTTDADLSVDDPTTSNGLVGADNLCRVHKDSETLERCYKAVIGDGSTSLASRITINGPIKVFNGTSFTTVDSDGSKFLTGGNLDAGFNFVQTGASGGGNSTFWSGSTIVGAINTANCVNWTSNLNPDRGRVGQSTSIAGAHIDSGTSFACNLSLPRVACISQ